MSFKDPDYSSSNVPTSSSSSNSGDDTELEKNEMPQGKKRHVIQNTRPPPKKSVIKRKINPQQWQRNISKTFKDNGSSYFSLQIFENPDGTKDKAQVTRKAKRNLSASTLLYENIRRTAPNNIQRILGNRRHPQTTNFYSVFHDHQKTNL